MIEVISYLDSRGVDYRTGGKNVGANDINICCFWCGEERYHMGIHKSKGFLHCWVCGFEGLDKYPSFLDLIAEIEGCTRDQAYRILKEFSSDEEDIEEKEDDFQGCGRGHRFGAKEA